MTPSQCRSARAWLDWNQSDLARESGVAVSTIKTIENNSRNPHPRTTAAIVETFRRNGVIFEPGKVICT